MSELPLSIGTMHFTGIGGIGMSGIGKSLNSDMQSKEAICRIMPMSRLRKKGISVVTGQSAKNIEGASLIIISTAIKPDNPEVLLALNLSP